MKRKSNSRRFERQGAASVGVLLVAFSALFIYPCNTVAQQMRRYEFSAGYAYIRVDSGMGALSLHGLSFSLTRNMNRWLAIVGDGGGYHLEGFRLGTVQAGVRFTARAAQRTSLFSQTLLGFAHANAGGRGFPTYHESVAWTVGGGFDWHVSDRVSLRLVQTEYVQTHLGSEVQHNFRASAGVVFHFGGLLTQ